MLMAMILLPVLNIGGMQLLRNADFNTLGKIMPRAKSIAFSIGAVYLVLTLACAATASPGRGCPGLDAIVHAMSSLTTAASSWPLRPADRTVAKCHTDYSEPWSSGSEISTPTLAVPSPISETNQHRDRSPGRKLRRTSPGCAAVNGPPG